MKRQVQGLTVCKNCGSKCGPDYCECPDSCIKQKWKGVRPIDRTNEAINMNKDESEFCERICKANGSLTNEQKKAFEDAFYDVDVSTKK